MKYIYLLLFTASLIAQNQPIKINITSITSTDSLSFRKFSINYSFSNLTDNKISFFLHPEKVHAGSGGSMSTFVSSKLYQETEELPLHLVLSFTSKSRELPSNFENLPEGKEKHEILKKYLKEVLGMDIDKEIEEISKNKDENYRLKKSSEELMNSIMVLEPKETKHYTKIYYWDKKRYYKIDELEYYINENSNCYLEFYIVLLKEHFKERMTEDDIKTLLNIPNFVEGWFTSNKIEINFRE
jgi:hypothetical protein